MYADILTRGNQRIVGSHFFQLKALNNTGVTFTWKGDTHDISYFDPFKDGDIIFYFNPILTRGRHQRVKWCVDAPKDIRIIR